MPFVKGQSGNPGGRLKLSDEVRDFARGLSLQAIQLHAEIMQNPDEPTPVRQKSADTILDRAWGKPTQPVDGDGDGGPIRTLFEIKFLKPGE